MEDDQKEADEANEALVREIIKTIQHQAAAIRSIQDVLVEWEMISREELSEIKRKHMNDINKRNIGSRTIQAPRGE